MKQITDHIFVPCHILGADVCGRIGCEHAPEAHAYALERGLVRVPGGRVTLIEAMEIMSLYGAWVPTEQQCEQ